MTHGADSRPRVVVIGVGNVLMGDDGLGVRAVERLQALRRWPDDVTCLDGGTLGLDLLPYAEGADVLIVLDAVRGGRAPGERIRIDGPMIGASHGARLSPHEAGVADLLAALHLRNAEPPRVIVFGLQPSAVRWAETLTPEVEAGLDALVTDVATEIDRLLAHRAAHGPG